MEASRAAPPPRARRSLRLVKRPADPAFEQLYRNHAREVYQYALALLANPSDAEDVTQTAFLNAYRAFQRGERPRTPHNWLIAITHNVCRMRWRQAGSRPREVALEEAPEPVALDYERPSLDEVLTALAGLSFNQRAALVMRELEGRSYQEIAEVLGVSVSAVEALLFRARRRLKLHRKALGVLTTVPLPGSLSSFLGAGGGAVAAGGASIGVLKAAAIVAAGAVTAGVGFKSVEVVTGSAGPEATRAKAQLASPGQNRAPAARDARRARGVAVRKDLRRATATGRSSSRFSQPTSPSNVPLASDNSAPPQLPTATSAIAISPPPLPVSVPLPTPVPPPPVTVPPPPVTVPVTVPAVTVPTLPVTVTTPTLPPPPLK